MTPGYRRVKEWRRKNPEKLRAQRRRWYARYAKKECQRARRQEKKYPGKNRARYIMRNRVRDGTLKKPDTCNRCHGRFPKREIQGHHPDHRRPLFVRWLCQRCHWIEEK